LRMSRLVNRRLRRRPKLRLLTPQIADIGGYHEMSSLWPTRKSASRTRERKWSLSEVAERQPIQKAAPYPRRIKPPDFHRGTDDNWLAGSPLRWGNGRVPLAAMKASAPAYASGGKSASGSAAWAAGSARTGLAIRRPMFLACLKLLRGVLLVATILCLAALSCQASSLLSRTICSGLS